MGKQKVHINRNGWNPTTNVVTGLCGHLNCIISKYENQ